MEKFEAAVASGEHTSGAGDLINLAENLDCYDFYIGVSDDETLGRIYAEDMEMIDIPENLRDYFDYEAYVTNLGKYNEGELASEPLKFPTTTEEVQALLKRIGVDNIQYEEIFIADYDGDLPELNACLGEYESIDELNHLACLLSELDKSDLEKFEAAVASGEHTSGVGDLINLVENLDCYDFYIGVSDDETLGRIYAEDMELINIPENLRDYFDYEAYGRDMRINEDGGFVKGGFFLPNGSQFTEYYHGREDIPDEHKVFAYPQLSIREQMAAYKEVIDRFPQAAERPRPEQSHTDR